MKTKFLSKGFSLQTKENVDVLMKLLKSHIAISDVIALGDLTDNKPGLIFVSGKDKDFSKILIFTARGVGEDTQKMNILYIFSYLSLTNSQFQLFTYAIDENPKLIRNLFLKIAKEDFLKIVKAIDLQDKIKLDWSRRIRFQDLHTNNGNLPKDFKFSRR